MSILTPGPPPLPSATFTSQVRRPGDYACPGGIVFEALEHVIQRHLLVLKGEDRARGKRASRMLVLTGAPGSGKTVAATDAALRYRYAVLQITAAHIASENEGGATARFDTYMADAVRHSNIFHESVAVVLDDFDLSIATNDADLGKTVNSNLLMQRLQSLADNDEFLNRDGSRIPLIFTGNAWSVRESLFRHGRATWYEHTPTADEVIDLVLHLMRPRSHRERRAVTRLARRYRKQSLAFWGLLLQHLRAEKMDALIDAGIDDPNVIRAELGRPIALDFDKLRTLARKHARKRRLSFL